MLYSFDDAQAPDRHVTQYFELLGGRAVYHEGWWCGTRHGNDGVSHAPHVPFDQDVWELYDMRTDFGHARDVAAKHPEKLKELQELFDREVPGVFHHLRGDFVRGLPLQFHFPIDVRLKDRGLRFHRIEFTPVDNRKGLVTRAHFFRLC
jgi:hypothetical protein